ncbi:MAG: prenyltransferase [Halanaerobacter sp.]
MDKLRLWLTALRPFSFTATIIPILLGTVLAVTEAGVINFYSFALVLVGVLLLHSGTNLINDYYDYQQGLDSRDYPGGSGVLVKKLIEPEKIKLAAIFCFGLSFLLATYLIYQQGLIVIVLFVLGLAGGYFYTAAPINYKYYALGVPGVFILLGPILIGAAYYIQVGSYNQKVFLISLPVALLVSAILHSNDLRDIEHDAEVGIKTLANILDKRLALQLYFLLLGLAYFLICYLSLRGVISYWALITLFTIPQLASNTFDLLLKKENRREKIKKLELKTVNLHFQFGLLLITALLIGNFL